MAKFDIDYSWSNKTVPFESIKGLTFSKVENNDNDEIVFYCTDGRIFRQVYHPDCCASCSVEEVIGDLSDLENTPILLAEEVTSSEPDTETLLNRTRDYEEEVADYIKQGREPYYDSLEAYLEGRHESETWTFYKVSTIKGSVTIRWYGSSNGYYSETASFEEVINEKE